MKHPQFVFPQLKHALLAWVHDALSRLGQDAVAVDNSPDLMRWARDGDGVFRNRDRFRPRWSMHARDGLSALDSWTAVLSAIHETAEVARQMDTMVGTSQRATRLEAQRLGSVVLPRPTEAGQVDEVFEQRYAELEAFLVADLIEQVVVWPVSRLSVHMMPLVLEPQVELDLMTDAELATALSLELVRSIFPGHLQLDPDDEDRTCLRYRYWLPKVVGVVAGEDDEVARRAWTDTENSLRKLRQCFEEALALTLAEPKLVAGRFIVAGGDWTPFGHSVAFDLAAVNRRVWTPPVALDAQQTHDLGAVWKLLRRLGPEPRHQGLALALRRLSYQAQRERPEDELLDLMIAAEALYLSSVGNETYRGELSYRLALRAAAYAEHLGPPFSKRDVFRLMQTAYEARSAIAHGGTPKPARLKLRGSTATLHDVVGATRSVLRSASKAALVQAIESTWPPDWDDLVIGLPAGS